MTNGNPLHFTPPRDQEFERLVKELLAEHDKSRQIQAVPSAENVGTVELVSEVKRRLAGLVVVFEEYEIRNLLGLLAWCGAGANHERVEPFHLANTGDWLYMVAHKLSAGDSTRVTAVGANCDAKEMEQRVKLWGEVQGMWKKWQEPQKVTVPAPAPGTDPASYLAPETFSISTNGAAFFGTTLTSHAVLTGPAQTVTSSNWKASCHAGFSDILRMEDLRNELHYGPSPLKVGDRILMIRQGSPSLDGIYLYNGPETPMTRAPDDDGKETFTVYVEEGQLEGFHQVKREPMDSHDGCEIRYLVDGPWHKVSIWTPKPQELFIAEVVAESKAKARKLAVEAYERQKAIGKPTAAGRLAEPVQLSSKEANGAETAQVVLDGISKVMGVRVNDQWLIQGKVIDLINERDELKKLRNELEHQLSQTRHTAAQQAQAAKSAPDQAYIGRLRNEITALRKKNRAIKEDYAKLAQTLPATKQAWLDMKNELRALRQAHAGYGQRFGWIHDLVLTHADGLRKVSAEFGTDIKADHPMDSLDDKIIERIKALKKERYDANTRFVECNESLQKAQLDQDKESRHRNDLLRRLSLTTGALETLCQRFGWTVPHNVNDANELATNVLENRDLQDAPKLLNLSLDQNGLEATIAGGNRMLQQFASNCLEVLDAHKAQNYLEMALSAPGRGDVTLTLGRAEGKTPHQLRRAAEDALAELKVKHEQLTKELELVRRPCVSIEAETVQAWKDLYDAKAAAQQKACCDEIEQERLAELAELSLAGKDIPGYQLLRFGSLVTGMTFWDNVKALLPGDTSGWTKFKVLPFDKAAELDSKDQSVRTLFLNPNRLVYVETEKFG